MLIYVSNRFISEKKAAVSVYDRGFLYGDAVFETLRIYNGQIFRLQDHIRRLIHSAQKLNIPLTFSEARLNKLLILAVTRNGLKEALLRISLTRGIGQIGTELARKSKPTLIISPRKFKGRPISDYRLGVKISIVSLRRTPSQALDASVKSANYLNNIMARIEASQQGAAEGLMLTLNGFLAEGAVSNIFFVKNNRLYTPDIRLGILPGITRGLTLRLARSLKIRVSEGRFRPADLLRSDECFLTNTSMEIMPVVKVDGRRIGRGIPGPLTQKLHFLLKGMIRMECQTITHRP